jgi:hypothetical protein
MPAHRLSHHPQSDETYRHFVDHGLAPAIGGSRLNVMLVRAVT